MGLIFALQNFSSFGRPPAIYMLTRTQRRAHNISLMPKMKEEQVHASASKNDDETTVLSKFRNAAIIFVDLMLQLFREARSKASEGKLMGWLYALAWKLISFCQILFGNKVGAFSCSRSIQIVPPNTAAGVSSMGSDRLVPAGEILDPILFPTAAAQGSGLDSSAGRSLSLIRGSYATSSPSFCVYDTDTVSVTSVSSRGISEIASVSNIADTPVPTLREESRFDAAKSSLSMFGPRYGQRPFPSPQESSSKLSPVPSLTGSDIYPITGSANTGAEEGLDSGNNVLSLLLVEDALDAPSTFCISQKINANHGTEPVARISPEGTSDLTLDANPEKQVPTPFEKTIIGVTKPNLEKPSNDTTYGQHLAWSPQACSQNTGTNISSISSDSAEIQEEVAFSSVSGESNPNSPPTESTAPVAENSNAKDGLHKYYDPKEDVSLLNKSKNFISWNDGDKDHAPFWTCYFVAPEGMYFPAGRLIQCDEAMYKKVDGLHWFGTKPEAMRAAAGRAMDCFSFRDTRARPSNRSDPRHCQETPEWPMSANMPVQYPGAVVKIEDLLERLRQGTYQQTTRDP
jgi:hypothetical protein